MDVIENFGAINVRWQWLKIDDNLLNSKKYKSVRAMVETEVDKQKRVARVIGNVPLAKNASPNVSNAKGKQGINLRKRKERNGKNFPL